MLNNLNKYRFIIEKVIGISLLTAQIIEESVQALDFTLFTDPKNIHKLLYKLKGLLTSVNSQKAVLLSYKLFKIYFRGVDLNDPKGQEEYPFSLILIVI